MEYRVDEIVEINKNSLKKANLPRYIKYLDTANITKGKIDNIVNLDTKSDDIPSRARRLVQTDDIIISTVRPNQEHYGYIEDSRSDLTVSTGFVVLTPRKDLINPYYLYLTLTTDQMTRKLQSIAEDSTSAYPSIKPSVIGNQILKLPAMKTQNSIATFFSNIDNKIEVNNKLMANLEELSQTLFKRWFVDFEFPDENRNPYKSYEGEFQYLKNLKLPLSWTINTIADNASGGIITGKTPSTKIKENYAPHGIPFITIPDMHKDVFVLNTERYISELGMSKLKNKILPKNSISVSCIATPGLVTITSKDSITNQQVNSFQPNKNKLYYLYFTLKRMKGYIRD